MPSAPRACGHPGHHGPCSVAGPGLQDAASIPASAGTGERCREKELVTFNSYTAADCQRQPNLIRAELDHYLMRTETN